MKEELIISGRNLPNIDPHLHIWHWPIYVDLFMGGLAAGILFFAAIYYLRNKEDSFPATVKWATFLAPVAIGIALLMLFIDLKHKLYFWRLYSTFKLESPMSFGSWILLFLTPISFLWAGSYLREWFPDWHRKWPLIQKAEIWFNAHKRAFAWAMLGLAMGLGIYTGILLSAFNARPLWNTSLLGPQFLLYGLLTGAGVIMWLARKPEEKRQFTQISLVLIIVQIFLILHLFLGYLAGPQVQVQSSALLLGGPLTFPFWGIVFGAGLLLPAILTGLMLRGVRLPSVIPALLILLGGFFFRMLLVQAGEMTRYLY